MSSTEDHTILINETRLDLGTEPGLTLWLNARVTYVHGQPRAKPGLGTGSTDIIGILAPQGRLIALEGKTGNAVPTKEQKMFMELIRKRGGFACVFHTKEEAREAIARARKGHSE